MRGQTIIIRWFDTCTQIHFFIDKNSYLIFAIGRKVGLFIPDQICLLLLSSLEMAQN